MFITSVYTNTHGAAGGLAADGAVPSVPLHGLARNNRPATRGYNCPYCARGPPTPKNRLSNNKLSHLLCFLYLSIPWTFPALLPATLAAMFLPESPARHLVFLAPLVVVIKQNVHARAPRANAAR